MKRLQYAIKFPTTLPHQLDQDEAYFTLTENDQDVTLRFHDYGALYQRARLYEQRFYTRLKCVSPKKVAETLNKVLIQNRAEVTELRVLDIGAGNGMFGEQMHNIGVARVVGIDICEEARLACERDRPGVYDAYYLCDLCNLDEQATDELRSWNLDCLACVAALGFGDIPARAFANAFNLIARGGWVAFNIKETFLQESDQSGFSSLVKALMLSDALEVHHLERYRHRISLDGRPLYYYTLIGRKEFDIPDHILSSIKDD